MKASEFAAGLILAAGRKTPSPRTAAVIVAAGKSTRMGGKGQKNLLTLAGKPVLAHTLLAFENAPNINQIVVVTRAEDIEQVWQIAHTYQITKLTAVTRGGTTRALSVQRGFALIEPKTKYVAIHDGARCLITPADIAKISRAAYRHRAATAATPVTDTVKNINHRGYINGTTDRNKLMLVQTPQIFHADLYRAALANVDDDTLTDDNQLLERIGYPIKPVNVGKHNLKITHPEDLALAEFILKEREATP